MARFFWTFTALLAGLIIGYFGVVLLIVVKGTLEGCLKNCYWPLWPVFLCVALPLMTLFALDIRAYVRTSAKNRKGPLRGFEPSWITRRAFPAGMALSSVLYHPVASYYISKWII